VHGAELFALRLRLQEKLPMTVALDELFAFIEEEVDAVGLRRVREAAQRVAVRYATSGSVGEFSREEAVAYAAMRLPGTFSALRRIFEETVPWLGSAGAVDVCDVFSGPATAVLALASLGHRLGRVVCVERAMEMQRLGQRLLARSGLEGAVEWMSQDVFEFSSGATPPFDVVISAYGLGEVPEEAQRAAVVSKLWEHAKCAFVCVEPGTPRGAAVIQDVRSQLIANGAHVYAPCPHGQACSFAMVGAGWCHFSVRLPRSRISRLVDDAQESYEDEKFTYVSFAREPRAEKLQGRIVGQPRTAKVGVELQVCLPTGPVVRVAVPKRDREAYGIARKLAWGDPLPRELGQMLGGTEKNK
jgi:ribosomal protein RSM22 (predicted rRNA methylase)